MKNKVDKEKSREKKNKETRGRFKIYSKWIQNKGEEGETDLGSRVH